MYREGAYNGSYEPEVKDDPYQEHHRRHSEDGFGTDVDSRAVNSTSRAQKHHNMHRDTRSASQMSDDPHGYNLGQDNYADLQRQLNDLEVETPYQPNRYDTVEPVESGPALVTGDRHYSSPERTYSPQEYYSSEFSSRGSSPKTHSSSRAPRSPTSKSRSSTTSTFQDGYREARHFAGGLIRHPSEHSEHYSILRHSHGLVFYQGTHTSVAISIFSDTPLPPDRAILLKPKNWSVVAQNRATFRRQTDNLLNVTPGVAVKSEQVNPSDERAWQRDIHEFERRNRSGSRSNHVLQETDVVRIPAEAGDGYFQLVLCVGERAETLCISPVFRILSVSSNMGAISGAHWATLPLEIGAIALSIQARRYVGAAFLPAKSRLKGKTGPYMPAHAGRAKTVGKLAYGATGAANMVGAQIASLNSKYHEERDGTFTPIWKIDDDYESGPKAPYPIRFVARCGISDDLPNERHILPMTKLKNVPEVATYKLSGYYFGWVAISSGSTDKSGRGSNQGRWLQAVIVVSPISVDSLEHVTLSRANRKEVQIQILDHHRPRRLLPNTSIKVEVFGCLRPWDQELERELAEDLQAGEEIAYETAFINEMSDLTLARTILDDPTWDPDAVRFQTGKDAEEELNEKKKKKGMERIKQEYTEKRLAVQKKIDQVPLHKVGVRMPIDILKDKSVVMNGFFIKR